MRVLIPAASPSLTEVIRRFPHKPMVDVFSKSDALADILAEAAEKRRASGHQGERSESTASTSTRVASSSSLERGTASTSGPATISDPVQFAAELPSAMAVSSLSEAGLEELKIRLISLISEHYRIDGQRDGWGEEKSSDGEEMLPFTHGH